MWNESVPKARILLYPPASERVGLAPKLQPVSQRRAPGWWQFNRCIDMQVNEKNPHNDCITINVRNFIFCSLSRLKFNAEQQKTFQIWKFNFIAASVSVAWEKNFRRTSSGVKQHKMPSQKKKCFMCDPINNFLWSAAPWDAVRATRESFHPSCIPLNLVKWEW